MASLRAYITSFVLKRRLKPRLHAAIDPVKVRNLFAPPPFRVPRGVKISPGEVGGMRGEWVESADSHDMMLYLHGGGYFACSPVTHRAITTGFARRGFRVFAPEYRLAPEHIFPAALDDACAAYRGLLEQGTAPERLVIAGDSAGGGLTMSTMLALRDQGTRLPAAAALFSPWTDLAATGQSLVDNDLRCAMFRGSGIGPAARMYLGQAEACNPLASPLYGDFRGLPPVLIHVGANEVLRDDSTRLAERALAAGVRVELRVWPVVPHVWQIVPWLPEARQSMNQAAAFLHTAVAAAVAPASADDTHVHN